jgi:hypothetical protein
MKALRQMLLDSHVSAVAIAVLLIWSVSYVLEGFWQPVFSTISFTMTAIAIRGLPFVPPRFSFAQREMIFVTCDELFNAAVSILAAIILSRWVYGMGPLRSLKMCHERLVRRDNV